MEVFLVCALVITNSLWLLFFHFRENYHREERTELQNRIAHPQMIVNPESGSVESHDNHIEPKDAIEYASVGTIDQYRPDDGEE